MINPEIKKFYPFLAIFCNLSIFVAIMKKSIAFIIILLASAASVMAQRHLAPRAAAQGAIEKTAITPAADEAQHQWTSLGKCAWTDDILTGLFTISSYETESEVQQDALNPALYRIVAPYGPDNKYYFALGGDLVDDGLNAYILLDTTDPDNVLLVSSPLGLAYSDTEEYRVCSYSWLAKQGVVTEAAVDYYGMRGKLRDGIITFPGKESFWIDSPTLEAIGKGLTANESGAFRLALPGAKDYSLELLTSSWCTDDAGNIVVSGWAGADVATVAAGFVAEPTEAAALELVYTGQMLTPRQGTYMTLPAGWLPNQRRYMAAVALDAQGLPHTVAFNMVYTPDRAEGWAKCPAKATFTDGIVSPVYSDISMGTYDVAVEQDLSRPGRFRLVDPYETAPYNTLGTTHGLHTHYIYVDVTDPDCVVLEESPVGMVLSTDGDLRVTSRAAMGLADGMTMAEVKSAGYGGILKDGVVTFPNKAYIYIGFLVEGPDYWMNTNVAWNGTSYVAGPLAIDLSRVMAGISDVTADAADTDAPLYDLYGRRVQGTPTPGIYVRAGRKVVIK